MRDRSLQLRVASRCPHRQRGQGLVEYALIITLVAVVVISILILVGLSSGSTFTITGDNL